MFFSVAQRGMYRPIDVEEKQVAASFRAERVEDCKVHKKNLYFCRKDSGLCRRSSYKHRKRNKRSS